MSASPLNLSRARKDRARAAAKRQADENTVRYGRTKAEKAIDRTEAERLRRNHNNHKREE